MRWKRFFFLLFLIPSLIHASFYAKDHAKIVDKVVVEWRRHEELIRKFTELELNAREQNLGLLRESITCCQRAIEHCDYILKKIADKPKHDRRDEYWVKAKNQHNQDKNTLNSEINELHALINNTLQQVAFTRANQLYQESEQKAYRAQAKSQNGSRRLNQIEETSATLNEASTLYEEALTLAREALNLISPYQDEDGKNFLSKTVEMYQEEATNSRKEATEWPAAALAQKSALQERLATLKEDARLFEDKGLKRSAYEVHKQMLPILEQLVKNQLSAEAELIQLQHTITLFETEADTNRLTEPTPALSKEAFRAREKERRELFFKNDPLLNRVMLSDEPSPCALPLDGQVIQQDTNFTLYAEQFYRFLVRSDEPVSELLVTVYEKGEMIHEEPIALNIKSTHSWERYLIADGMTLIPETRLNTDFGLDVRLTFSCDPQYKFSMIIAQKGSLPGYQFSFSIKNKNPLYACSFLQPPPWQLSILKKPSLSRSDRPLTKKEGVYAPYLKDESFTPLEEEHFPLLDQFVDQLKKDPFALAGYVYNEIALEHRFPHQEEEAFLAPGIRKNACMTFLDKEGSPWEQCQLLVYLLRKAGYSSLYIAETPCSIPKAFLEKMLLVKLPEDQEEGVVNYPGVLFFDGEEWISLFPWMKEMQLDEGYDLYNLMPEEYASADRWILRYLKGDERIFKHVGPDGDDTLGVLFVRFVEEELRKQGLSLSDVGIQRTQIKKQFSSWIDFPRPSTLGDLEIFSSLNKNSTLFARALIEIFSHENPQKKISHTMPLVDLNCNAIPLRFTDHQLVAHFLGEQEERLLNLDASDRTISITVACGNFIGSQMTHLVKTISMDRGTDATLCFYLGGESSNVTSQFYQQFSSEQEETKRLHALLAFVGAAYFEKCSCAERALASLHKTPPINFHNIHYHTTRRAGPNGKLRLFQARDMIPTTSCPSTSPSSLTFYLICAPARMAARGRRSRRINRSRRT